MESSEKTPAEKFVELIKNMDTDELRRRELHTKFLIGEADKVEDKTIQVQGMERQSM